MRQQQQWKEVKGQIKSKFGKLNDSEIESLNGHMDRLQNKVQKAYAYTETKAKQECKAFNESLNQNP
jgi:uncharacterized protein YjbJ (UPF0337 family)